MANPTLVLDEKLRPYATDKQWACYLAYVNAGSNRKAAADMGHNDESRVRYAVKAIMKKAGSDGYTPLPAVEANLIMKGQSTLYKVLPDGTDVEVGRWDKTKLEGRDPSEVTHVVDPKLITKISTNYDQTGRVVQQWIAEKPELAAREALWQTFAKEMASAVDRSESITAPIAPFKTSMMAVYPVGDHHVGMEAWGEETGDVNYDLKISEKLLRDASTHLMRQCPPCETALIEFLGDFMHYDSFKPITPEHGNLLDADSRFPKMVRTAIRMMRHMITAALEYHQKVHVIVEVGNHDLSSSIFLMELLANVYENEPRITVDTSPAHYHYHRFGKVLIGTHHGHGSKPEKLPMVMAHDRAEDWGATTHRYWHTGHIHSRTVFEFPGCSAESFNILAPADAWAAQKGFRSTKNAKALVMHKEYGEIERHTVSPLMFQ